MKRRHPRQVVDHAAFRPGDEYSLVRADPADEGLQPRISIGTMTFAAALNNGDMEEAQAVLSRHPADSGLRLTTHDIHGEIVVVSWQWDGALANSWPFASMDARRHHLMFVPTAYWVTDPRFHVVDWVNPDDVCCAGLTWAEEEALLRRRRDAAMRRTLGFD